ncbi:MAG: hypothetical protein ABI548_02785 [Polyangiaceae bacterium]
MPPIGPVDASVAPQFTQAQIDAAFTNQPWKTLYKLANQGCISVGNFIIMGPQYDTKGNLLVASQTFYATPAFLTLLPAGAVIPGP